jgi:allantoinase
METYDLLIRAPRAVIGGSETAASVGVRKGAIAAIEPLDSGATAAETLELTSGVVLLPGLVDSHVHVC